MQAEPCEVQNISKPTKIECNKRNVVCGLLFKNKLSIIYQALIHPVHLDIADFKPFNYQLVSEQKFTHTEANSEIQAIIQIQISDCIKYCLFLDFTLNQLNKNFWGQALDICISNKFCLHKNLLGCLKAILLYSISSLRCLQWLMAWPKPVEAPLGKLLCSGFCNPAGVAADSNFPA